MNHRPAPLTIILTFAGFFLVLWLVHQMLETEFFRGNPDLGGLETAVHNSLTVMAHRVCVDEVQKRSKTGADHAGESWTAWDIGFNRYLIQGNGTPDQRAQEYLCRVNLGKGDPDRPENWHVDNIKWIP